MDEKTYKQWWQLHLRAALGETLSSDEQNEYESGLKVLYEEERVQFLQTNGLTELRELRSQVERLQTTNDQLKDESTRLDKKIAAL
jgi:predicted RNase H-like nuclease (RuvC/YqgF family)